LETLKMIQERLNAISWTIKIEPKEWNSLKKN
jgi:hypothetical protein